MITLHHCHSLVCYGALLLLLLFVMAQTGSPLSQCVSGDSAQFDNHPHSSFTSANCKILQWNCRSLHTNLAYFQQFLSSNDFHVMCLQSVGRRPSELPLFNGYYFPPFYKCRSDGCVSVATYVKTGLQTQFIKPPCSSSSLAVCIQLQFKDRPFNVVNIYYPDGCSDKTDWLSE